METKAIDGVSISQLQNKFMTGDELIPVEYDGKIIILIQEIFLIM